jgi:hypothetical protein
MMLCATKNEMDFIYSRNLRKNEIHFIFIRFSFISLQRNSFLL